MLTMHFNHLPKQN